MRAWASVLILATTSCASHPEPVSDEAVRIIFTADEHGWLRGQWKKAEKKRLGGAELLMRELTAINYDPTRDLLLSGGDSWTGPALSTLLHGEPIVELFNHLNYDAAALGNHEFDFGLDVLKRNQSRATFPLLAANVRWNDPKREGRPYPGSMIVEAKGKRFGIIGLTNAETHKATSPHHVEQLRFEPYQGAILREAQSLKERGADALVILMHDDAQLLKPMQQELQQRYGLVAVMGGHVHRFDKAQLGGVAYCNPKDKLQEICVVTVKDGMGHLDVRSLESSDQKIQHPWLERLITRSQARLGALDAEVLGDLKDALHARDNVVESHLGQLVGIAWLASVPAANVAITNHGSLRQDLEPGEITRRDLRSIMPFDNDLVVLTLSKEQLKTTMSNTQSLTTGAEIRSGEVWVGGKPMAKDATVRVVVNSFMYAGGNHYTLKAFDPEATRLHRSWRQPVADYLKSLQAEEQTLSRSLIQARWKALNP
ncbi:MAG: hypothetical protein CMH50_08630 [Myxococcales bacterium]|nr:hypothetical protein [Myxococcales bacterium]|tara:strand:+ start:776 stop:2230 length:1455 start_codon:yes stop_codon:yes gene_type:complete